MKVLNHKAAPKGLKAINAIYDAQIQQNVINQWVQKTYLKEYTHTREKNKIKKKLSTLNQSLGELNPYYKKPKSFYSKTSMAQVSPYST